MAVLVPFGRYVDGRLHGPDDDNIPNGARCECVCPGCGDCLIRKGRGTVRRPYFSHATQPPTQNCAETAVHLAHKQAVKDIEGERFELPPGPEDDEASAWEFKAQGPREWQIPTGDLAVEVRLESSIPGTSRVADCIIVGADGMEYILEICVTNRKDEGWHMETEAARSWSLEYVVPSHDLKAIPDGRDIIKSSVWLYEPASAITKKYNMRLRLAWEELRQGKAKRAHRVALDNLLGDRIRHIPNRPITNDKYGNEIWGITKIAVNLSANRLAQLGLRQDSKRPTLFYLRGAGVTAYADLDSTDVIPIWESGGAAALWTRPFNHPYRDLYLCAFGTWLEKGGITVRRHFMDETVGMHECWQPRDER